MAELVKLERDWQEFEKRKVRVVAMDRTIAAEETWDTLNRRRSDLIRRSRSAGPSAAEAEELEQLQAAVDRRLEPRDRQLLAAAENFRNLAGGLPDESTP